jgi:FixJ family two-component response regulator
MTAQSSPIIQHSSTKQKDMRPLIAFIDYDEHVRDAATLLMESYGLDIKTYSSGTVFISDINNGINPSCIMLDLHLPDINVIDLMQELIRRKIHTPVIILSVDVLHPLAVQALELGAVKVLQKPVISEKLLVKIHEIISP